MSHLIPLLAQIGIILQPLLKLTKEFSLMNEIFTQEVARVFFDYIIAIFPNNYDIINQVPGVPSDKVTGLSDKTKGLTSAMVGGRPGEGGSSNNQPSDSDMSNEKGKGKRRAEEQLVPEHIGDKRKGKKPAREQSDSDYMDPDYNNSQFMSEKRRGKLPARDQSFSDLGQQRRSERVAQQQPVDYNYEAVLEQVLIASRTDQGGDPNQGGESSRTAALRGFGEAAESARIAQLRASYAMEDSSRANQPQNPSQPGDLSSRGNQGGESSSAAALPDN